MTEETAAYAQPLTLLSEDEIIFRDSVRDFADAQVRPLVREMDEHAKFSKTLLGQLFDGDLKAADRWLKGEGRTLYAPFG